MRSLKKPLPLGRGVVTKLVRLKNGNDKCPHCGTIFHNNIESLHPFDVEVREEFRKRRSKAAKKGWKKRRAAMPFGVPVASRTR
jgi:hypothetical protein